MPSRWNRTWSLVTGSRVQIRLMAIVALVIGMSVTRFIGSDGLVSHLILSDELKPHTSSSAKPAISPVAISPSSTVTADSVTMERLQSATFIARRDILRHHNDRLTVDRFGQQLPTGLSHQGPAVYVFPLQPPSSASFSEGHHSYPAVDIFAAAGTRYVAVTSGRIDELSRQDLWDPSVDDPATRGGLYVSLIGDDGVRYYGSHLSAILPNLAPGDHVVAGQLLGHVGNSGNARGITPHLHFGMSRPTHPGDWAVRRGQIWPQFYLRAWLRGEMLTPDLRETHSGDTGP